MEKIRDIIKQKRDEYYVGLFSAANRPVAAYRFSDHEQMTPFGFEEDAQKWIDEQAARRVIATVLDAIAEPTEAMVKMAVEVWPNLDDRTDMLLWGGVYRAMITALKKDLEGG